MIEDIQSRVQKWIDNRTKFSKEEKASERGLYYKLRRSGLYWERLPFVVPDPDVLVDVGAGKGTRSLYKVYKAARIVMIDALEENREPLAELSTRFEGSQVVIQALGAAQRKTRMKVPASDKTGTASLMNRIGHKSKASAEVRTVEIRPLDDVLPGVLADDGAKLGLKIDAEGYEREILKGAARTLKRTLWIVAEISLAPRFKEDPLFDGVYGELRRHGFVFRDIVDVTRQGFGDLRRIDGLFVREDLVNYAMELRRSRAAG
jgi:FkbM family methyltransferase